MRDFFYRAAALHRGEEPFVVVTLVSSRGHAPSDPGAKAIVQRQGLVAGTVGGGKIEARTISFAKELLAGEDFAPKIMTWNLQTDIGMTCGGEVTYLFECYHPTAWTIAVFGAGHVAQALVRSLLPLENRLWCIDHRPEWVERLPSEEKLQRLCLPEPARQVVELPSHTSFVVMTQGHAFDVPILEMVFRHHPRAPYIGVIGSDSKKAKIRSELRARGVSDELLERLRCPMGLPLGTNRPEEIAVSITAELLQLRDRKA